MQHWITITLAAVFALLTGCEAQQAVPTGGSSAPTEQASGPSGSSSKSTATLPGGQKLSGEPTQVPYLTWCGGVWHRC